MASKAPSAKGSACASAWIGVTRSARPAASTRRWFSCGLIQRSAAVTWTPNSFAKKIDDTALPQPRSRMRIPGLRSIASLRYSASHSAFGPIRLSATQPPS